MDTRRPRLAAALLAGALLPATAWAAAVDLGASNLGGNALVDHSGPGLLSFDVQLTSPAPLELVIQLDPGESSVAWNGSFERPTTAESLDGYRVTLAGATLTPGTVHDSLAREVTNVVVSGGDTEAELGFDQVESAFHLGGAPGLVPAATDWPISAPSPGGTFQMTLTPLPEPSALAPGAALLALTAAGRRRR